MTETRISGVRPRRSFIFSPGLRPDMFPKALACGTDIVCVELEDGIAPRDKAAARESGLGLFAEPQADDGVERIVRINCLRTEFGLLDVQAVIAEQSLDHWCDVFRNVDCCVEPVLDWHEIAHHEHIAARGQIDVSADIPAALIGLRIDGNAPGPRRPVRRCMHHRHRHQPPCTGSYRHRRRILHRRDRAVLALLFVLFWASWPHF